MLDHLPHGYRSRPAEAGDAEELTAMFNAYALGLLGIAPHRAADLLVEWREPGFEPGSDTVVVVGPNGSLVGYAEVWDTQEPHVRLFSWGRVYPDHHGHGIGTRLLAWEEARACRAIERAPAGARVTLRQGVFAQDAPAHALFDRGGFRVVRHFLRMETSVDGPLERPTWPAGISVRTFDPDRDLEPAVMALRDAFQDHWGNIVPPLETDLAAWRHMVAEDKGFDPSLWYLAVADGRIVGVCGCWQDLAEDPRLGVVGSLGVVRPWRRRGVALALLMHAFAELKQRGKTRIQLGVDASSLTGATRLYERAGMRPIRTTHLYEKELRAGRDLTTQQLDRTGEEGGDFREASTP